MFDNNQVTEIVFVLSILYLFLKKVLLLTTLQI